MVNQGKSTTQLPTKTSFYDVADRLVFIYGADSANPSIAQTATITIENFVNSYANVLQIPVQQADPANSESLTIQQGQIFASNSFIYVAIANNVTMRAQLSSF